MEINQNSIAAYKEILTNPSAYGFHDTPAIQDCFVAADFATAKHILYEQYLNRIKKPVPKIFFYIIMDGMYIQAKAPNGYFGYMVRIKE